MNKGFTLVELLAVIIILSVLALITVSSVNLILKDSKKSLTDVQIDNIKETANLYYIKHGIVLEDLGLQDPQNCINVSELIDSGYIDKEEVTNPKTREQILGSVKVTYSANNYIYEYQDNTCTNYDRGIICERVKSTELGNVPQGKFVAGDAYNCKVNPNKEPYKFYILTTPGDDSDMVNLIMDRNINSDGTPMTVAISQENANGGIYNKVSWISKTDYISAGGKIALEGEVYSYNDKGPITAMNFLEEATKDWTNITEMIIDSFQMVMEDGLVISKEMKEYKTHARMPYYKEVSSFDSTKNNGYLYEHLDPREWHYGVSTKPTNNIENIFGYWTLSIPYDTNYTSRAWDVDYHGGVDKDEDVWEYADGVRPVISVYKFQME